MLSRKTFDVLNQVYKAPGCSERDISGACKLDSSVISSALAELRKDSLIEGESLVITPQGLETLVPFRVKNAIIMAAGLSSRLAPISYEQPKGLLKVCGEVLIERQIRQLKEAGIDDIVVVVGYMKEKFYYLEDLYGVTIVFNPEYAQRNNNSTLYAARDRLDNTYICSSDNYFTENPFETYVYSAYYSCVYFEGKTDEYVPKTKGEELLIVGVDYDGGDDWGTLGHAYFDREFSRKFVKFLEQDYSQPETAGKYWEDVYLDHVSELPMVARHYPGGVVWEFDNLDEFKAFDSQFLENVDSVAFDDICSTLGCTRNQVENIEPIKDDSTSPSFRFAVDGVDYVYRYSSADASEDVVCRDSIQPAVV